MTNYIILPELPDITHFTKEFHKTSEYFVTIGMPKKTVFSSQYYNFTNNFNG